MSPWVDVPEEAMGEKIAKEFLDPFLDEEVFCGLENPEECESCG
jgi:hypothetical protein